MTTLDEPNRKRPSAAAAWHPRCRELVMTLTPGTPEAAAAVSAPHWRRSRGNEPADLTARFGRLLRKVGERGRVGRAFTAARRDNPSDPFADRVELTVQERQSGMGRVVRLGVDDPVAAARLAGLLRESDFVDSLHPVMPRTLTGIDEVEFDPIPVAQPGGWAWQVIRAQEALEIERGDPAVIVAVIDSGIELSHPEFRSKLVGGHDFVALEDSDVALQGDIRTRDPDPNDDTGHGTHVAGVIGARGRQMLPGLAGRCRLMPVRVLGTRLEGGRKVGVGNIVDIDDGIKFAVDSGADVINLSLGVQADATGIPHQRAVRYARMHDVCVVAASGNHGSREPLFPAAVPGVITVGAISEFRRVAGFSGWGDHVDVVAPGTAIYSTDLGDRYRYRDGTSHASPFVAAVAALLVSRARSAGMRLREKTIRRIIRDTADPAGRQRWDAYFGGGVLNALDAVLLATHLIRSQLRERPTRSARHIESPPARGWQPAA
jgi:subtilisin family serine protease